MGRREIGFWMALVAAGTAFAVPDDFAEHLLEAQQLYRQGEYAGAESTLLAALKEADRLGPDEARKAIVWNNLGSLYQSMNRYPQAEQCYRSAVEIEARLWGADQDRPIRAVLNLASLYIEAGQYAKAGRLGLQGLAEQLPQARRNDSDFARLLALLGDLEQRQGRYRQAEEYGEKALALLEKLAPDGSQTMGTLNNLCVLYGESGRNLEALSHCQRALRIAEGSRDPDPSLRPSLLANVGTFQFLLHGPEQAEPFYKKALVLGESALGAQHPVVGRILLCYAVVLERTRRKGQAKEYRRRAQSILDAASTADGSKYTVDLGELLRKSAHR